MNHKYIQSSIALLITLHLTLSSETNAPVYEVVNEQARIDDNIRLSNNPVILPYGNPLAGNSKQNARLHASNQQAMFNAERIRQHKAQLQRYNNSPKIIDSYMKAYHELQENHQLEIEQQQATFKDSPVTASPTSSPRSRTKQRVQNKRVPNNDDSQNERQLIKRVQSQRKELPRRVPQRINPVKASKGEGLRDIRNRNHRSYGSTDYQQLEPKRYQVYVSSFTSFDQGIAVEPNSNIGSYSVSQPSKLYTKVVASDTKPTYPKQLDHKFTSVQEIEALNSLLAKNPEQQLTEFTALLNSDKNEEINKDVPADLYYYLTNPTQVHNIDSSKATYASAYVPVIRDHTPITEEIDDIEDPNNKEAKIFSEPTVSPKIETATTKSNNYYKVGVASQTITKDKPYLLYGLQENSDKSERYLHHNAQTTGLQHILEDGTETSAYEDNVSSKVRSKRSKLETDSFLLPEKKANTTDTPTSEALIRVNPFNKKRDSLDVYLPNFQIGEASYDYDFDYKQSNSKLNTFYEDDYYDDYEIGSKSQDFGPSNYQSEVKSSFSNRLHHFRRVPLSSIYGTPPSTSYGVPFYGSPTHFSSPQSYFPHKFESTVSSISFDHLEPVYMLTQSQLKELIGHHNLNIGHLDVYQLTKENKGKKYSHPRKYRKRYPFRHVQKNLFKLHKFNS